MNVAIIHYRIVKAGGLETRLLNYVSYFLYRGDAVTVIHAKRDQALKLSDQAKLIKVPVKWIPKPLRMWWFGNRSCRFLRQNQFDLSLSLGRTPGQEILICPGTHLGFLHAMPPRIYRPLDHLNIYLDRQAFRTSKIILAASRMIASELTQFYDIPTEKIRVLYPPSDPAVFNYNLRNERGLIQKKLGIDPQKKNFLFVSSGHSRKGLHVLLAVCRMMNNYPVHFHIAGAPVRTALPQNVTYHGFVEDLPRLYSAVDALIHPALYEPYGQVVSESLMCGTPVIVSAKTGASELVQQNEGIVLDSFDPALWAAALKQFMSAKWNVPENFAERNGLTIESHMRKMMEARSA